MKKRKASGTSGVVTDMLLASGDASLERMSSLFNCTLKDERIPTECNAIVIINCFKNKSEATDRGNYRDLELLEHMMKIFKRIIEKKNQEKDRYK